MRVHCQNTKIDFKPSISDFIGNLDIYDREETLGVYLDRFDPNNRGDVCNLLKEMFFMVLALVGYQFHIKSFLWSC